MARMLNIALPLAAAALLAALAVTNRPARVLSAPPAKSERVPGPPRIGKPTTRPASKGKKDGPRTGSRGFLRLTPQQEEEILTYLKRRRPEIHEQMVQLKEKDAARYRRALRNIHSFLARIRKLPKPVAAAHEDMQQSYLKLWRLAREYGRAETAERKQQLEAAMREQADKQFHAEQIVRRHRLSELEAQIRELKAELDRRAKESDAIIQETVEQFKRSAARYADKDKGHDGKKPDRQRPGPGAKKAGKPAHGTVTPE